VIGYGSRPISRRRSRARKKRYVTLVAMLLIGALTAGLGYVALSSGKAALIGQPSIEAQQ
jgi:hypothetical protein